MGDPALVLLGRIVNGADTDNTLWNQPEVRGSKRSPRAWPRLNHEINAAEWIVYDALYAYSRGDGAPGKAGRRIQVTTPARFQRRIIMRGDVGADADAVVAGDVALLEHEVTPVLKTLRANAIDLVAIQHRMTGTDPVVVSALLRHWAGREVGACGSRGGGPARRAGARALSLIEQNDRPNAGTVARRAFKTPSTSWMPFQR